MAVLKAKKRNSLPKASFAIPESRSYPIHDRAHAANALARAKGKPEERRVRAAVCRRYPDLPACKERSMIEVVSDLNCEPCREYAEYPAPRREKRERNGGLRLYAGDPGEIPGTNWVQVTPEERKKLHGLIEYYRKKPHPFRACVRDNTKRFGPGRVERICAVIKDLIEGGTHWRKGARKLADGTELVAVPEPFMTLDELVEVIEQAEAIAGGSPTPDPFVRSFYDPHEPRAPQGVREGGRWILGGFHLDSSKDPVGGGEPSSGGVPVPSAPRGPDKLPDVGPGKVTLKRTNEKATGGGVMGRAIDLPKYDVVVDGETRGEVYVALSRAEHHHSAGSAKVWYGKRAGGDRLDRRPRQFGSKNDARDYVANGPPPTVRSEPGSSGGSFQPTTVQEWERQVAERRAEQARIDAESARRDRRQGEIRAGLLAREKAGESKSMTTQNRNALAFDLAAPDPRLGREDPIATVEAGLIPLVEAGDVGSLVQLEGELKERLRRLRAEHRGMTDPNARRLNEIQRQGVQTALADVARALKAAQSQRAYGPK